MEEKVCIIIPVGENSAKSLEACLESCFNLSYPVFDIIIVDDSKDGRLRDLFDNKEDKRIKVLQSYAKGPSYARNLAAKNTDAKFLAFTDSDCLVDVNWFKELLKGFATFPEAVACGGIQKITADANSFEKKVFLFMQKVGFITDYIKKSTRKDIVEVTHNPSCCVVYRRDIFLKEGGFREGLWPGEDVELDFRLRQKGYQIIFNPKAMVYHYRPKCLRGFLEMMYRYGFACGRLTRMYGIFRRIQMLPLLSLAMVILLILSAMFNFLYPVLICFGIAFCFFFIYIGFSPHVFFLCVMALISWDAGFIDGFIKRCKMTK